MLLYVTSLQAEGTREDGFFTVVSVASYVDGNIRWLAGSLI